MVRLSAYRRRWYHAFPVAAATISGVELHSIKWSSVLLCLTFILFNTKKKNFFFWRDSSARPPVCRLQQTTFQRPKNSTQPTRSTPTPCHCSTVCGTRRPRWYFSFYFLYLIIYTFIFFFFLGFPGAHFAAVGAGIPTRCDWCICPSELVIDALADASIQARVRKKESIHQRVP